MELPEPPRTPDPWEIRIAMSDPDPRHAMMLHDRLPRPWRELVYQHGQGKVMALLMRGYDLQAARTMLPPPEPGKRRLR
jgi:hypothetical protein